MATNRENQYKEKRPTLSNEASLLVVKESPEQTGASHTSYGSINLVVLICPQLCPLPRRRLFITHWLSSPLLNAEYTYYKSLKIVNFYITKWIHGIGIPSKI